MPAARARRRGLARRPRARHRDPRARRGHPRRTRRGRPGRLQRPAGQTSRSDQPGEPAERGGQAQRASGATVHRPSLPDSDHGSCSRRSHRNSVRCPLGATPKMPRPRTIRPVCRTTHRRGGSHTVITMVSAKPTGDPGPRHNLGASPGAAADLRPPHPLALPGPVHRHVPHPLRIGRHQHPGRDFQRRGHGSTLAVPLRRAGRASLGWAADTW